MPMYNVMITFRGSYEFTVEANSEAEAEIIGNSLLREVDLERYLDTSYDPPVASLSGDQNDTPVLTRDEAVAANFHLMDDDWEDEDA